jgi:Fic family protein
MKRDNLTHTVRERLQRLPVPYDAHYGVVPQAPPEGHVPVGNAPSHASAMRAVQRANQIAASLPHHYPLSRILARQEAVNSSSIENTNSTLDAVLEAEEADSDALHDEATSQVRDYAIALETSLKEIEQQRRVGFTRELVKRLHKTLMLGDTTYQDIPGEFRSRVVWIGGDRIEHSTFNPPPPNRVTDCIDEHIAYLRTDGMQPFEQSIILRLAIAHAHFEAVHPFRDGNGRVGRLLLPLMMAADGHAPLYLSPFINSQKPRYYDALKSAQQQLDYSLLLELLSEAIIYAVSEADQTIAALQKLVVIWRQRQHFRTGSSAARGMEILSAYPVITANRLAKELGTTYAAANKGIAALVSADVLTELTGHRRNRMFAARDVLRIFNRPFGELPELPEK